MFQWRGQITQITIVCDPARTHGPLVHSQAQAKRRRSTDKDQRSKDKTPTQPVRRPFLDDELLESRTRSPSKQGNTSQTWLSLQRSNTGPSTVHPTRQLSGRSSGCAITSSRCSIARRVDSAIGGRDYGVLLCRSVARFCLANYQSSGSSHVQPVCTL